MPASDVAPSTSAPAPHSSPDDSTRTLFQSPAPAPEQDARDTDPPESNDPAAQHERMDKSAKRANQRAAKHRRDSESHPDYAVLVALPLDELEHRYQQAKAQKAACMEDLRHLTDTLGARLAGVLTQQEAHAVMHNHSEVLPHTLTHAEQQCTWIVVLQQPCLPLANPFHWQLQISYLLLDASVQALNGLYADGMSSLQTMIKVWKLARVYDADLCSLKSISDICVHVIGDAVKALQLPGCMNPMVRVDALKQFLAAANKAIDSDVPFQQTERNAGWYAVPLKAVAALLNSMNHRNQDVADSENNVVVLALATDKAPVHHNGRALVMGHLEDLTCMVKGRQASAVPNFKDPTKAVLIAAFESKDESNETLRSNYSPYIEVMAQHEEGLHRREAELMPLQEKLRSAAMHRNDMVPESISAYDHAKSDVDTWYAAAAAQGHVVHLRERGYFFVEWHVITDMACLRSAVGVEGQGSKNQPCSLCTKLWAQFELLGPNAQMRDTSSTAVFPLPQHRYHACAMHCKHRITERFLYNLMNWLSNAIASAPDVGLKRQLEHRRNVLVMLLNSTTSVLLRVCWQNEEVVDVSHAAAHDDDLDSDSMHTDNVEPELSADAEDDGGLLAGVTLEELQQRLHAAANPVAQDNAEPDRFFTLRGMHMNGGRCNFSYDAYGKLVMLGMNGDDVHRYLQQGKVLFEYVMGDIMPNVSAKWGTAVESWRKQLSYMADNDMTAEVQQEAIAHAKQFVKEYRDAAGPRSITYYLHWLHDHPEWFYCLDVSNRFVVSVAWFTAQAMEAAHRIRKQVLRNHTMHGMSILRWKPAEDADAVEQQELVTCAPQIYELFRWQWRMLLYRRLEQEEALACSLVTYTCAFLNKLAGFRRGEDYVWAEDEVVQALGHLPGTALRVIGPGNVLSKLLVHCSFSTHFADQAFSVNGGGLFARFSTWKGRLPKLMQPEEVQQAVIDSRHTDLLAKREHAIMQTGHPTMDDLFVSAMK